MKKALEEAGQTKVQAAENRLFLHDKKVFYLSRYCGEEKPRCFDLLEERSALEKTGFTDTLGNANLRIVEGELRVFDTEKHSFDPKAYEEIDAMEGTREKIEALLLSKVEK